MCVTLGQRLLTMATGEERSPAMPDPDYEPNANTIRQAVLDEIARQGAAGRDYSVDAELADAIASAVLARLASLEDRREHAQKFDMWTELLETFLNIFNKEAVPGEALRNSILSVLRQHQDDITNAVMKAIDKRKTG